MIKPVKFFRREWSTGVPDPPVETQDFELVLPSEFLVSSYVGAATNAASPASKIGQDLHFFPSDWGRKARSARQLVTGSSGANAFAKVNWSEHNFLFTNYSRHPVQMFAEFLIGANRSAWNRPDPTLGESAGQPVYTDQTVGTQWPDQLPNVETFVLPPTLDRNDMGAKVTWSPGKLNWNRIFGPDYADATPTSDHAYPALGPWLQIENDHLESNQDNGPVVFADPATDVPVNSMEPFQARLRFYAVVMEPHGGLYKTDKGIDASAADGRSLLDTDAINIEVQSKWDTTLAFVGSIRHEPGFADARDTRAQ